MSNLNDFPEIPYSEAEVRICKWIAFASSDPKIAASGPIRSLYFSKDDFLDLFNQNDDMVGFRIYFGINEVDSKDQLCGMVVKVINNDTCNYCDVVDPTSEEHSGIMDFSRPCPDFCDVASPMYNVDCTEQE